MKLAKSFLQCILIVGFFSLQLSEVKAQESQKNNLYKFDRLTPKQKLLGASFCAASGVVVAVKGFSFSASLYKEVLKPVFYKHKGLGRAITLFTFLTGLYARLAFVSGDLAYTTYTQYKLLKKTN